MSTVTFGAFELLDHHSLATYCDVQNDRIQYGPCRDMLPRSITQLLNILITLEFIQQLVML